MIIKEIKMWEKVPCMCLETPKLTAYLPEKRTSDAAIVIFPGGGYHHRSVHEGRGYAEFFCEHGISAFVVDYRLMPHYFPIPLIDARRAIQLVRYHAEEYGVCKDKIAVMGSSAGGHLAALTSTYFDEIPECCQDDDVSNEDIVPNAQILCYPLIGIWGRESAHTGCGRNLLDDKLEELGEQLSVYNIVKPNTPPAFIWHTITDDTVDPENSLDYAYALKRKSIPVELHIYTCGRHGLGIPTTDDKVAKHISSWADSMISWLEYMDFLKK